MSVIRRQNKEVMRMSCSRVSHQLHNRRSTGACSDIGESFLASEHKRCQRKEGLN